MNTGDGFPGGHADEVALYLGWLGFLRGAVLRKVAGLDDAGARWTPDGRLIPLVGIVNHLTKVEWRWIDGAILGDETSRTEAEFHPDLPIAEAVAAYRRRAEHTDRAVRSLPLSTPCRAGDGTDLRWVVLHLINETARHAGHADAVRELLDGVTGE